MITRSISEWDGFPTMSIPALPRFSYVFPTHKRELCQAAVLCVHPPLCNASKRSGSYMGRVRSRNSNIIPDAETRKNRLIGIYSVADDSGRDAKRKRRIETVTGDDAKAPNPAESASQSAALGQQCRDQNLLTCPTRIYHPALPTMMLL
jgi:hypothetical protein